MSLPNNLLRLWAARLASKIAICSAMTYDLYQLSKARGKDSSLKLSIKDEKRRQLGKGVKSNKRTIADVFIESLVAAGSCRHHSSIRQHAITEQSASQSSRQFRRIGSRYDGARHFSMEHRRCQTAVASAKPETAKREHKPPLITKEEYNELVNIYGSPPDIWDKPQPVALHLPLAPRLVIPPETEDKPPFTPRYVLPPEDEAHAQHLRNFRRQLDREPGRISLTKFWDTYQDLRAPRLRYLADDDIRRAFRHLTWVQYRTAEGALPRYFSLLEECIGEQIPVTLSEWNTAIAYAGRWVRHSTSQEVRGAVETWMRMERHGLTANHVTFNILFDVAVRANRFALADTIHNELRMRKLPLDRFFRTSLIYYAGMRGDGDAVRQAFRDLVNAGEIVDTTTMNCVILSLVRAGEPAAAEHVFAKMKRLHEQKLGTDSVHDWQEQRHLAVLLNLSAERLRREKHRHQGSFFGSQFSTDDRREEVQRITPIAPNVNTYRILIQHHAYTSGDLDRICELLNEMKGQGLQATGSVYVHLFRGFWQHGGFSHTAWTRTRLEELWDEFNAAADEASTSAAAAAMAAGENDDDGPDHLQDGGPPRFTRPLAHGVLRAFYKCAGKPKMLEVWAEIKAKWKDIGVEDHAISQSLVEKLVREDSVYIV